jgi:hypothetical protein
MRSQLFGFSVEAHLIYEADLNCSLTHAHQVTLQFTQQLGMINGSSGALPQVSVLTPQPYSLGVETWLTPMDTEIEEITSDIVRQYGCADEMKRMKLLKQALDWRWLKFRETAIIAQLFLSTTLEGTVHLSIQLGWNEGASSESRTLSTNFVQGYIARLKQLSLLYKWRTAYPPLPEVMEPKSYGIRPDTYEKLRKLREIREEERLKGTIVTTRLAACDAVGIAISTVKKYDKMLYDRWYETSYEPPT